MWDSRNFKKYFAFGESAYSITLHHSDKSGISDESSDTDDLGNTGGSDYFCTMGDSVIFVEQMSEYIRIKKMLHSNIQIYSFKKNYTNIIWKYSNIRNFCY